MEITILGLLIMIAFISGYVTAGYILGIFKSDEDS